MGFSSFRVAFDPAHPLHDPLQLSRSEPLALFRFGSHHEPSHRAGPPDQQQCCWCPALPSAYRSGISTAYSPNSLRKSASNVLLKVWVASRVHQFESPNTVAPRAAHLSTGVFRAMQ